MRLYRHKEMLKKDILKKRALLEKEIQIEIQNELVNEISTRTKQELLKRVDNSKSPNGSGKKRYIFFSCVLLLIK